MKALDMWGYFYWGGTGWLCYMAGDPLVSPPPGKKVYHFSIPIPDEVAGETVEVAVEEPQPQSSTP